MSNEPRCNCGDREASKCPGEWEPGCDLGANPKYAKVVPFEQPEALRLADALAELRRQNAEIKRLQQCELAFQQWIEKTEWVQQAARPEELGMHRADALRQRIENLTAQNYALSQGIEFANRLVETLRAEIDQLRGNHEQT
jgi:predicted RNase H-like nuclease (RuvC/YqgF family)